jgi:hypothetical protein
MLLADDQDPMRHESAVEDFWGIRRHRPGEIEVANFNASNVFQDFDVHVSSRAVD